MYERRDAKDAADSVAIKPQTKASLSVSDPRAEPPVIFDFPGLMMRVDQDRDIAREIADVFLQDTPNLLDAVQRACRRKDIPALHRAAHALKGASSCAGANLIRQSAQGLQNAASEPEYDRIVGIINLLESQVAAYRELFEQTFPEVGGSGTDRSRES
jgi:HPt (histidine-containing phosphotransfer) domain-containing protein